MTASVPITKRRQASLTTAVDTPGAVRLSQHPVETKFFTSIPPEVLEKVSNRASAGDRDAKLTPLSLQRHLEKEL
jgi:hypothetical protein